MSRTTKDDKLAGTGAERAYEAYALVDIEDPRGDPDVLLDVPVLEVDSIHLELDNLDAHVADASAGGVAKLAAKMVVQELKSAAADEAKELGLAAARKAKQVGERRKERKAEELNATEAALRTADELDVDLEGVEGSGPEGRITIRDVRQAQEVS